MLPIESLDDDVTLDPPAQFASDAEIELADRLLRALEARYLEPCAVPAPSRAPSAGEHREAATARAPARGQASPGTSRLSRCRNCE